MSDPVPILTGTRLERFWKQRIRNAGFSPEMFVLKTDAPKDIIHREQYIAAMAIFYAMYCNPEGKVSWVHLVAEMQAGKTGVCDALIRIIRRNVEGKDAKLSADVYSNIFVVTGLSDCSWVKQTRERLSAGVNVYHGATLGKMQTKLKQLAERPGGLRDVLIIVDESHVASAKNNRPYKCIYSEVRSCLSDAKTWAGRGVHFLTVSATDPRAVLMMAEADIPARAVALETTGVYQSVQSLRDAGRIRNAANIGSTPETVDMLKEAVDAYGAPRYHIIRAEGKLNQAAVDLLKETFEDARVLTWDAKTKGGAGDGSTMSENDINDLLSTPPEVTTFIVIKRMFSCAKTMVDRYVGVLWDYVSLDDKDSVRLQSLLGRACGYGRSKDTVVYTSMRVVDDYLEHWRDAMRSVEDMREAKEDAPDGGNWGNVGVLRDDGKLMRSKRHVSPVAADDEDEDEPEDPPVATGPAGDPLVFATLAAAKAWVERNLVAGASTFIPCDHTGGKTAETHFKYRGVRREIRSVAETMASRDLAWGQGKVKRDGTRTGSPRIMPVLGGGGIAWIVVFKPHWQR